MENINNIEGSPDTFETLVNNVKLKLYKTGMAILKDDDDTCDAIQETLISAYKNFDKLKEKRYFSTWITRILINKCYDLIKKKKKITYLNQQLEQPENASYYDIYSEDSILERVLNNIDSDLKLVTVLYYYDEFSIKEISEMINIPEGTVKSRLSRARERIYEILKMEEGEDIG